MAPQQVWLVNGASRGIGQEHARQALQAGYTVLAACRTPSKATELQKLVKEHPGQLHLLTLDVTDEKSIEAAAAEAAKLCPHGIDVLINNAGIAGKFTLASQTEAEDYLEVLRVNVVGPVMVSKHFLPLLRKSSVRPKIVNISSAMGSITKNRENKAKPMYSMGVPYQSSKSCLNMQTAILANELQDMTVISMCPGFVATDMNADMRENSKELAAQAMTPAVSVTKQRKVIEEVKPEDSGMFFGHEGKYYPW